MIYNNKEKWDSEDSKWLFITLGTMFFLWMAITCNVMRFKHPEMTETQLILNAHRAIMLDFSK
jgi:hypothetical protein